MDVIKDYMSETNTMGMYVPDIPMVKYIAKRIWKTLARGRRKVLNNMQQNGNIYSNDAFLEVQYSTICDMEMQIPYLRYYFRTYRHPEM